MDVWGQVRRMRWMAMVVCVHVLTLGRAQADPMYTAVDLGTGSLTYGVNAQGNGTVTGSNGLTYVFNPAQNSLPAQWSNTTQGVPIVQPAPVGNSYTYGDPSNAYSNSNLIAMNAQGLAAGIDQYGVAGHLANSEAFLAQQQANGSWGTPIPLWSGSETMAGYGTSGVGILGVAANGQVLGYGVEDPTSSTSPTLLYLYDSRTQTITNLTSVVDAMSWTTATNLPGGQSPNWSLSSVLAQIDNQGEILVQATEGYSGTPHNVLLIPDGLSTSEVAAPEPAATAMFAVVMGGLLVHAYRQRRGRSAR